MEFVDIELAGDLVLHVYPCKKYKTVVVRAYVHQDLDERATMTALIPFVLQRGCAAYPSLESLRGRLDSLYGVSLDVDVAKVGVRQMMIFDLEAPDPEMAPGGKGLLGDALAVFGQVLIDPLVHDDGFDSAYVGQERDVMHSRLEGLINDKVRYAMHRCFEEMCKGENFAIESYGRLKDLGAVDRKALLTYYRELLATTRIDLYVVGNVKPEVVSGLFRASFPVERRPAESALTSAGPMYKRPVSVKRVEEPLQVSQSKLCMGFRTNTSYGDSLSHALLFYNGILGGFTHSKLFQNVREKASLAYYATSGLERTYGVLYIHCGIEGEDVRQVLAIIDQQLEAMRAGEISDREFHCTREALIRQWKISQDNPRELMARHLQSSINGQSFVPDEFLAGLESVRPADIPAAAERVVLDTVYLLRASDGEVKQR